MGISGQIILHIVSILSKQSSGYFSGSCERKAQVGAGLSACRCSRPTDQPGGKNEKLRNLDGQ